MHGTDDGALSEDEVDGGRGVVEAHAMISIISRMPDVESPRRHPVPQPQLQLVAFPREPQLRSAWQLGGEGGGAFHHSLQRLRPVSSLGGGSDAVGRHLLRQAPSLGQVHLRSHAQTLHAGQDGSTEGSDQPPAVSSRPSLLARASPVHAAHAMPSARVHVSSGALLLARLPPSPAVAAADPTRRARPSTAAIHPLLRQARASELTLLPRPARLAEASLLLSFPDTPALARARPFRSTWLRSLLRRNERSLSRKLISSACCWGSTDVAASAGPTLRNWRQGADQRTTGSRRLLLVRGGEPSVVRTPRCGRGGWDKRRGKGSCGGGRGGRGGWSPGRSW
mmetsp:Transcript_18058/g.59309  ORF Transcript_18058/g.59309 Transcript_18058/m.59309 type:complete len:338 (-) Transcript_18058:382-1395(-)